MRFASAGLLIIGFALFASCDRDKSGPGGSQRMTIAVIPKGTTQAFWNSVEKGAKRAGAEAGAEIRWKGAIQESDRAMQIQIVEQFVSEGVSAIVLAPTDENALLRPVEEANARNIPVVIFDSALKGTPGKNFVSFVATDNRVGGTMGGKELLRLLNGKGKVVLLRYQEGSASTTEREEGFLEVMDAAPGIQVIMKNRYGGTTQGEAQRASMNLLDTLKEADGVFCPNESTTLGMLHALKDGGLAGKVKLVGFDDSPPMVEALREGTIDALVAQDPVKIGYDGVQAAIAAIHHKPVALRIDTGVKLLTKANLDTPEVKKLLEN